MCLCEDMSKISFLPNNIQTMKGRNLVLNTKDTVILPIEDYGDKEILSLYFYPWSKENEIVENSLSKWKMAEARKYLNKLLPFHNMDNIYSNQLPNFNDAGSPFDDEEKIEKKNNE